MSQQLKGRTFGIIGFLFMAGCVAFNWYLLINDGYFYPKAGGLCPVVAMFSLMLVAFPSMVGSRPSKSQPKSVVIPLIAGLIGLAIGGVNFYLMESYHR